MTGRPDAPATRRNRAAILDVLRSEFSAAGKVLEIGSGTGQHAVFFARELPNVTWQTSDRRENHAAIIAWIAHSGLKNVINPIDLDVLASRPPGREYNAVFSANTAHIMSFAAVSAMFAIVSGCLLNDGVFCLYGPFNEGGQFTSTSNEAFDQSLRAQDPDMGIRNIEDLQETAAQVGLRRYRTYAMPANNQVLVWRPQ